MPGASTFTYKANLSEFALLFVGDYGDRDPPSPATVKTAQLLCTQVTGMDASQIESLLWQSESETLDFKVQPYPFDGATPEQRGELIKDILAFANAWRQTDAHILIGVEEVKRGHSIVRGVDQHIENRTLTTFVVSKLNRFLSFSYSTVNMEGGKRVDVITIPVQERPFFLKESYGRLAANTVYIRRGETTATADPAEIAQMGVARDTHITPVLDFEFANLEERQGIGMTVPVSRRNVEIPSNSQIDNYGPDYALFGSSLSNENEHYYRDLARYLRDYTHLSPVGVAIRNGSTVTAEKVVARIRFDAREVETVTLRPPKEPTKDRMLRAMPSLAPDPEGLRLEKFGTTFEATVSLGDIQPGITNWSRHPFFIGSRYTINASVGVTLSAHNLRVPIELAGTFVFDITQVKITPDFIYQMGDSE